MQHSWSGHLDILRCPVSGEALREMSDDEIAQLNAEAAAGERMHADGSPITEPLNGAAVINTSGTHTYRIEDDIAWMLPILAIVSAGRAGSSLLAAESGLVRKFYEEFGWATNAAGEFNDSILFTRGDDTAAAYNARCNGRVLDELAGGEYLLDAASGPVPGPSYEILSKHYIKRICVDFSHAALLGAKRAIGDHGLYLLGDLTALPLRDSVIDDAISLHTIYHIPEQMQATAVDELARVVKPGGKAVIVYEWSSSPIMAAANAATMSAGFMRNLFRKRQARQMVTEQLIESAPELYFRPQNRAWLAPLKQRHNLRLQIFSVANARFSRAVFRNSPVGRLAARTVFAAEKILEPITARFGTYPLFVISKP